MRKLKLFLSLLMVMLLSVGNVWATDYKKTALADITSSDVVIIVGNNGSLCALSNDNGTGSAPSAVSVSATNDVITTDATNILWNIAKDGNNLTIYPNGTTETWLYCTATNNGVRVGTNANKVFVIDNTNNSNNNAAQNDYLYNSATNRWLGVYNSSDWRCYTTIGANIKNQALSFYVLQEESGDDVTVKTLKSIALSGQTTSFYQNAAFAFDGTCTATYSVTKNDVAQADEQKVVTPTSVSSPDMTTLGNKEVTVTFTDGEVSKEAKYTITVTEAPAAVNYEKVTAEPADWSGEYLLVYEADATNARVWKGADQANYYAEAAISNGVIAAPDGAAVLTIAKVAESSPVVYTIKVGEKYIGQTSDANGMKIQDAAINNSISYNTTDAAVDIVASSAHLRYNSASSSYFRYYKSATYSGQKKIQLYKKVDGTVKEAAGLAYAEADKKKLAKLGDAFTAPTLVNPHGVAVTYASSAESVAEVAANGAVTIKAAGVATITASFAGNDDYKEGSASYTIGVVNHAGTEADPYDVADARNVIDAFGTKEGVYMSGIVSQITTSYDETYHNISFDISTDGTPTADQVRAFRCKGLDNTDFTSEDDVKTSATVTVYGNLTKYNSTYEFEAGCYLKAYEAPAVPKTHIANDQAHPYTVAQALEYAADGATYDLDDYVYIQGVVYDVKSFNNGVMNIFIKDANIENQFEFFKCEGINDGSATTPFEALTDVQVGNIVIGYGQMMYYQDGDIYEFKAGNYLVDLQVPATGIELDATAEVEAGSTVNLTATILPSNATGTIVWSVESGDAYASVENGVVTGIAEGEAVIRATVQGTEIYAECTVTVTPEAAPDTRKVANSPAAFTTISGDLDPADIAFEAFKGGAGTAPANYNNGIRLYQISGSNAFGGYITLTAVAGCTIDEVQITTTSTYSTTVAYSKDGNENLLKSESVSASGSYTTGNGLNVQSVNIVNLGTSGSGRLEIASIKVYYTGEAATIDHYELGGTYATEFEVGDDFNHNGLIVYAAYDALGENKVDITSACTFSTPDMSTEGEKTIEITYKDAVVKSYTITVNASTDTRKIAESPATFTAVSGDMTPADITFASYKGGAGNDPYLATNGIRLYQISGSNEFGGFITLTAKKGCTIDQVKVTTSDSYATTVAYSVDGNENLLGSESVAKSSDYTTPAGLNVESVNILNLGTGSSGRLEIASIKVWYTGDALAVDHYILGGTYATEFEQYGEFNHEGLIVYAAYDAQGDDKEDITAACTFSEPDMSEAGEKTIEITYKEAVVKSYTITVNASAKEDPAFEYSPASATITAGDEWNAPTLNKAFEVSPISFVSDKPAVATVDENGVITLVGGYGTAVITASFEGDDDYLASEATYTITVNEPGDDLTGTWVLASSVAAGDKFIVVGSYNNKTMAMGKQNSNNRAAVASSVDEWNVLTPGVGTKVFTLVDAGEGKFAIQASNGKYLSAAGTGTNNYLREAADFEADNAKWTISIENGVANVVASSNNRNVMRYNSTNNSELFSCYQSGAQRDIQIYKIGTPDYGSYNRDGLTAGNYATICLPNAGTIEGAKLFDLDYYDGANTLYLLEVNGNAMVAGRPYIFLPEANEITVTYTDNAGADAGSFNGLVGSYTQQTVAIGTGDEANYILYQNAYYLVNSEAYVGENRAYIHMAGVSTTPTPQVGQAPRRRVGMSVHGEKTTTDIDALNASDTPIKMIIDGQLFIIRGEKMFNANGQVVK